VDGRVMNLGKLDGAQARIRIGHKRRNWLQKAYLIPMNTIKKI
jgi:hypothetical protein